MKFARPFIKIKGKNFNLLSPAEFKRKHQINISGATLSYQFEKDKLDYCDFDGVRMIVWNDKAVNFKLTGAGRKKIQE